MNLRLALSEAGRVLKSGGQVIIPLDPPTFKDKQAYLSWVARSGFIHYSLGEVKGQLIRLDFDDFKFEKIPSTVLPKFCRPTTEVDFLYYFVSARIIKEGSQAESSAGVLGAFVPGLPFGSWVSVLKTMFLSQRISPSNTIEERKYNENKIRLISGIPSDGELMRRFYKGQSEISGYDFGAGFGETTESLCLFLKENFGRARFFGLENFYFKVQIAKENNRPVEYFDVDMLVPLTDESEKVNLVTAFAPRPITLGSFVKTAKEIITPNGLVFIQLALADMNNLIAGRELFNELRPETAWDILSDFTLMQFTGRNFNFSSNPYVFIYSPRGLGHLSQPESLVEKSSLQSKAVKDDKENFNALVPGLFFLLPVLGTVILKSGDDWKAAFEDNARPLAVHVGFGGGKTFLEQARLNPDKNFIGIQPDQYQVDWFALRIEAAFQKIHGYPLTNLKIVQGFDYLLFDAQIEQGNRAILDEFNYYHPTPRSPYAFRGINQEDLVALLKPGALLRFEFQQEESGFRRIIRELKLKGFLELEANEHNFPDNLDFFGSGEKHLLQWPESSKQTISALVPGSLGLIAPGTMSALL